MKDYNSSSQWTTIRDDKLKLPLLSIITVTKKDEVGLERTILSLKKILDNRVELLIVSGDAENKIETADLNFGAIEIINHQDSGIYSAMNCGIKRSNGHFIWFLNGGDISLIENINFLEDFTSHPLLPNLLCNYRINFGSRSSIRSSRLAEYLWHGLPTSHQAIFYESSVLKLFGYNNRYKIAADYELTAKLYKRGSKFIRVQETVAEFNADGVSGKNLFKLISEVNHIQQYILKNPSHVRLASTGIHLISGFARKTQRIFG